MPRVVNSPEDFTVIAENIHATRALHRDGRRVSTLEDGSEAVTYKDGSGEDRYLRIPESFKETQPYQQGQIKHFMIAMHKGIGDDPAEEAEGRNYILNEVRRQTAAGAHYLDLNVDELSYRIEVQKKAMEWLVRTVQEASPVPPSVDSSNPEIIASGLDEYDGRAGRPVVNSVALERLETMELVKQHDGRVIVTAAGADGMPQDAEERVSNVREIMEAVQAGGIPLADVYVDCLVFPIAVSPGYGNHYLDAVRQVRELYGPDVHITGGLSNVSFGLPNRKLINDTFIHLCLEAGIDTGIVDPIQSKVGRVLSLDVETEPFQLASDALLGRDEFCMSYIQAWRDKRLSAG